MEQLSKPLHVYCLTAVTDARGDTHNVVMPADKTTAWNDVNINNCDEPVSNGNALVVAPAVAAAATTAAAPAAAGDAAATDSNTVGCDQVDQPESEQFDGTAHYAALNGHSVPNSDHCEQQTQQTTAHCRARRGKLIHTSKALADALHTALDIQLSEAAAKTLFTQLDTDSSGTLSAYDIVYGVQHILSLINSNNSNDISTVQKRQRRKPQRTVHRAEQCDSNNVCHEAVDSPKTAGLKLHDYWSAQVEQHQQQSLHATVTEQHHSGSNSNKSSRTPRAMSQAIDSTQSYSGNWQPAIGSSRMSAAAAGRESIYT
jgi:hypothetical protein